MKTYTPSELRENIYRILDDVATKKTPVSVKSKGVLLRIVPPEKKSRLASLKKRKIIRTDPEALVHCDWRHEWKPKSF